MSDFKIELNHAGIQALLTSGEVQAEVTRRAQAVAAAADERTGRPGDHRVESGSTGKRARAAVITDTWNARHREADSRTLTSSLDAGRA